jgi:HK97 gp10 family phage protein
MLSTKVDLKINNNFINKFESSINEAVEKAASDLEKELKKSILTGEKSGELYNVGNKLHRSSAPGQAPASDSGALANSIKHKKIKNNEFDVTISSNYAIFLEFGTSRIQPRPFIRPGIEKIRKRLGSAITAIRRKNGI